MKRFAFKNSLLATKAILNAEFLVFGTKTLQKIILSNSGMNIAFTAENYK